MWSAVPATCSRSIPSPGSDRSPSRSSAPLRSAASSGSRSTPRIHPPIGTANPRFGRTTIDVGTSSAASARSSPFARPPGISTPAGRCPASSATRVSSSGQRTSSATAIDARSTFRNSSYGR